GEPGSHVHPRVSLRRLRRDVRVLHGRGVPLVRECLPMTAGFPLSAGQDLELDVLDERDAEELFALVDANRTYLREWLPWLDQNTEVEHTRVFIRATRKQYEEGNGFTCVIRL